MGQGRATLGSGQNSTRPGPSGRIGTGKSGGDHGPGCQGCRLAGACRCREQQGLRLAGCCAAGWREGRPAPTHLTPDPTCHCQLTQTRRFLPHPTSGSVVCSPRLLSPHQIHNLSFLHVKDAFSLKFSTFSHVKTIIFLHTSQVTNCPFVGSGTWNT